MLWGAIKGGGAVCIFPIISWQTHTRLLPNLSEIVHFGNLSPSILHLFGGIFHEWTTTDIAITADFVAKHFETIAFKCSPKELSSRKMQFSSFLKQQPVHLSAYWNNFLVKTMHQLKNRCIFNWSSKLFFGFSLNLNYKDHIHNDWIYHFEIFSKNYCSGNFMNTALQKVFTSLLDRALPWLNSGIL